MRWTTEPPTEPGLYRVEIRHVSNAFYALLRGSAPFLVLSFFTEQLEPAELVSLSYISHWAGPFPEPEEVE